jgi:hypothetical protein
MGFIRRLALLSVLLLSLAALPARAVTTPSLRIWTANDHGVADLRPGGRVSVVIELRSQAAYNATLQHLTPAGLMLDSASATAGIVVSEPFVSWAGTVSQAQPVNITLLYRVRADEMAGDRTLRAQAQVNGELLKASSVLRICCASFPSAVWRMSLPVIRR